MRKTGEKVQGKQTTPNYKVKTRIKKPESEWVRIEKEYVQMKQEYDRQIEVSEQALQSYEHELELLKNNKGSRQEWIKEFKKYEDITVLNRSVVTAIPLVTGGILCALAAVLLNKRTD